MSKLSKLPNFSDRSLLQRALTHRSYVNEHSEVQKHNERLEFLGDAILNFLSGEFLYKKFPGTPEGELTKLRTVLVDEKQLAKFAVSLNLGQELRLGKGAEKEGGRSNPNLLSSVFEAVIGAYFLDADSSIDAVRRYIKPFFEDVLPQLQEVKSDKFLSAEALASREIAQSNSIAQLTSNYKSQFQEWVQAKFSQNPSYVIVGELGADHAKEFVAEVRVGDKVYGQGRGHRKQEAEKDAARAALDRLGLV